ncbi:hypothetical protein KFU94_58985 [Chloroflexi bacterium TSY]|nr:hypothetical protein [Chloroflexi bacterium TSY]
MAQTNHYMKLLKRNWWFIILTGMTALSLALAFAYVKEPQYRARTRFLVSPGPSLLSANRDRDLVYSIEALETRSIIATYAEVMGSKRIYHEAGAVLQLSPRTLDLYQVGAVVLPETSALDLSVTGPNPVIASLLANQVGQHAINHINGLYQAYAITTLDPASPPNNPFTPTPARDGVLALFLGLFVSVSIILISDQLTGSRSQNESLRSHAHLEQNGELGVTPVAQLEMSNRVRVTDPVQPTPPLHRIQLAKKQPPVARNRVDR